MIMREEGPAALYKGFIPKVLRLAPGGGVLLLVVEFTLEVFRKGSFLLPISLLRPPISHVVRAFPFCSSRASLRVSALSFAPYPGRSVCGRGHISITAFYYRRRVIL